jgi:hypothetical protein
MVKCDVFFEVRTEFLNAIGGRRLETIILLLESLMTDGESI